MKTLTKQETIQEHRKMWNWIADETEKRKRKVDKYEYFKEMNIDYVDRPCQYCYCCEYNMQNYNGGIRSCKLCPINWKSEINHGQCANIYVTSDFKRLDKGLFGQWRDSDDYQESALLARQIANLPESKDKEEDTKNE